MAQNTVKIKLKRLLSSFIFKVGLDDFAIRVHDFLAIIRSWRDWRKLIKTGRVSLPVSVTFEPTMVCNLACPFCYQKNYRKSVIGKMLDSQLTTDEIKTIFSEVRPYIKNLGLVGGEIFVRSDIFELLEHFDGFNIPMNIVTNGVLVDREVAKKLKKLRNLEAICYSIHGLERIHDKSVGRKGAFNKAIEGIKNMAGSRVWISTNTVLNQDNLAELTGLVKFLKEVGVDSAGFQLELFTRVQEAKVSLKRMGMSQSELALICKEKDEYEFSFQNFRLALEAAKKQARKVGLPVNLTSNPPRRHPRVFFQGKIRGVGIKLGCFDIANCRIDAWGNVVGCVALKKNFGNLKEKSFIQIINSKELIEFRKKILQDNLLPVCKRCCQATII